MSVPGDNPATPPFDPAPVPRLDGKAAWCEASQLAHGWARGLSHGHEHLAEDVAQEALLLASKNATTIHGNWKAWLHTVVSRLAIKKLKAERAERKCRDTEPDVTADLPAKGPWPQECVIERENHEELSRWL